MSIAIIDYGMGNLLSVRNGLIAVGASPVVVERGDDLRDAHAIVLPGVGAFGQGMAGLRARGFEEALHREVREGGKAFLGICLGLQLLARRGHELGEHAGLGWLPGEVHRLEPMGAARVPHIGWNDVTGHGVLFQGIPPAASFYFVHSYHFVPDADTSIALNSTTEHGGVRFVSALETANVHAVQFHPEKSHKHGLALLRNFVALAAQH